MVGNNEKSIASCRHVQRTSAEHDEIFQILKQFPRFMSLDNRTDLLRQVVEVAHLEICDENKQPGEYSSILFSSSPPPPPLTDL